MILLRKAPLAAAVALAIPVVLVSGCGGSSSGGDDTSDSTVASRGVITGFGSVYVNGTRYSTNGTRFRVDDDPGSESDLRVGMIVTVKGSKSDDGRNGHASYIEYDNELKGPVSAITPDPLDASRMTLTILGQAVEVNADTTIDDDGGLTFATIQVGDVLEVSAFKTAAGLVATHIELQPNADDIEIKGAIENLDTILMTFEIDGFAVSYDLNTELDDIGTLENGLFVEVDGQLDGAGTTLLADGIEGENEGLDDDMDDAEVEGTIYDYNAVDETFTIQGQAVDASDATLYPSSLVLADGLVVEAEGQIVGGVLQAYKVEQKGKKIKIQATLTGVGADSVSFTFNATEIDARVNHQTEIEDEINGGDIDISQLSVGNYVELEAFDDGSGVINAVEIKLKNPGEIRVEAPVSTWNEVAQSVAMLGVDFDLSAATYEDDLDQTISAAAFYGALAVGEFVEIQDADSNGIFDKAELDD